MGNINQEQVVKAYQSAPEAVRAVFNSEETTKTVSNLQKRLELHIDSAGTLAKEIGYLLLGVTNPNIFVQRLKNSGFSPEIIKEITAEINQKIFIPLRKQEEEQGMGGAPKAQPAPVMPKPAPLPGAAPSAAPRPVVAPGAGAPRAVPSPQLSDPNSAPLPPKTVLPRPGGTPMAPHPVMVAPAAPLAASKLLEDHEEPSPSFAAPASAQPAADPAPAPVVPTMPVPIPPQPAPAPRPVPVVPAPITAYTRDPYREPVDEPADEG